MERSVRNLVRGVGVLAVFVVALTLVFVAHPAGQAAKPAAPAAKPAAHAPAAPSGPMGQIVIVDVKPDSWDEYVTLQKTETMPALQKAGVERRRAWRTAALGKAFQVAYLYPLASMAVFDGPGPLERAFGADGLRVYNTKMRKLLVSSRAMTFRTREDLSYGLGGAIPKMGVVAHVQTVAGRQFEFEGFLKSQWGPALKKAGVPMYVVQEITMGGEMGEYYTFTPIDNFATLDAGHPIMHALGHAEYAALVAKMGMSIRSVERSVMKLDEDLSYDTTTK